MLIFICAKGYSQNDDEKEFWGGINITSSLNKKLRFETEHQYRTLNNLINKKSNLHEFSIRYKINRNFYFEPSYRITYMPVLNNDRSRFSANLFYKFRFKGFPIRFVNRFRYQYIKMIHTQNKGGVFRNKLTLRYKLSKKVISKLSFEIFMKNYEPSTLYGKDFELSNYRIKPCITWRISKQFEMDAFYGFEKQMKRKNNDVTHIIGLIAVYNFKVKRQSKNE